MVGLSSTQLLAFSVVVLAFLATIAYLSFQAKGRIRSKDAPDIPPSMQPGPSDADLEKPRLEKLQGWSLLFVAMFVVWVPLVWLKEPSQNQAQEAALLRDSIARGRDDVELYSQTNQGGIGCVRCHGDNPPLGGGFNLYNGVRVQVPNLRTVCAGPNVPQHSAIHNLIDIKNTVMQGRPGTDMPSWSVRFQGALDDQQIQDILNYIVSIQDPKLVPFKENVCVNLKAKGYQPPVVAAQ